MKQIISDSINGKPYLGVEVVDTTLRLVLLQYQPDWKFVMDKRVIPELIKILKEHA
jgi:hypothetical protein